jgi:uncharacterized protein YuzE
MKVKVDLKADALYFRLSDDRVENSQEVSQGVILDFNKSGIVVGIELLGIKNRFPLEDLSHFKVDVSTVA